MDFYKMGCAHALEKLGMGGVRAARQYAASGAGSKMPSAVAEALGGVAETPIKATILDRLRGLGIRGSEAVTGAGDALRNLTPEQHTLLQQLGIGGGVGAVAGGGAGYGLAPEGSEGLGAASGALLGGAAGALGGRGLGRGLGSLRKLEQTLGQITPPGLPG